MDTDEPYQPASPGADSPGGDHLPATPYGPYGPIPDIGGTTQRGRFTPLETWQGYGTVQASTGGHYVLYLNLRGGMANGEGGHFSCSGRGCDSLFGSGKLCTQAGQTYTFEVSGAVHSWWSTDGAAASVDLTNSPPLPDGWVVALHGAWHGPALQLSSPDNSFTEVFTPRGTIRSVTSTADAGTAQTTVRYGTDGDFTAACRRLAG